MVQMQRLDDLHTSLHIEASQGEGQKKKTRGSNLGHQVTKSTILAALAKIRAQGRPSSGSKWIAHPLPSK